VRLDAPNRQRFSGQAARRQTVKQKLSRDEMLVLVSRIFRAEGTEEAGDADIEHFVANCAHPSGTDLIFWPNLVPEFGEGHEPTVEEVVDLAMRGRT
jgi:hypothetical protein